MSIISCTYFFSNLKSGIPYFKLPPSSVSFSNTVTLNPFFLSSYAHSNPAGPDPITAIFSFLSSVLLYFFLLLVLVALKIVLGQIPYKLSLKIAN